MTSTKEKFPQIKASLRGRTIQVSVSSALKEGNLWFKNTIGEEKVFFQFRTTEWDYAVEETTIEQLSKLPIREVKVAISLLSAMKESAEQCKK